MTSKPRADGTESVAGLQLPAGTAKKTEAPEPERPHAIRMEFWSCSVCAWKSVSGSHAVTVHIEKHHPAKP